MVTGLNLSAVGIKVKNMLRIDKPVEKIIPLKKLKLFLYKNDNYMIGISQELWKQIVLSYFYFELCNGFRSFRFGGLLSTKQAAADNLE